jgi:ABC-type multidrug transport system permease subunit
MWAIFMARNLEYFRDTAAFGWNFLFPFLIIGGFAVLFGGSSFQENKVGVFPCPETTVHSESLELPPAFRSASYIDFVGFKTQAEGLDRLRHHKIDLLIRQGTAPYVYWIDENSPRGALLEKALLSSLQPAPPGNLLQKNRIEGRQIRYIDWLFPGILCMNMMFSSLWGVGYVVVRYRKNGVLKRFKATPLTAFEYVTAQIASRIFLLMFTLCVVWVGCSMLFSLYTAGSVVDVLVVLFLGSFCMTSLGMLLAARGSSEEFSSGVLNFITWPMMFLSEVWFSIEGAPGWVRTFSKMLPLTHVLEAVRGIMNDGRTLVDVSGNIAILVIMTGIFLTASALLFSWND